MTQRLDALRPIAEAAGLRLPHVVHEGGALGVDEALARLGAHGFHGAIDPAEGLVWRIERGDAVTAAAKYVRPGKQDGVYLADRTGREAIWNTWQARTP